MVAFFNCFGDGCLGVLNVALFLVVVCAEVLCGWSVLGHVGEIALLVNSVDTFLYRDLFYAFNWDCFKDAKLSVFLGFYS